MKHLTALLLALLGVAWAHTHAQDSVVVISEIHYNPEGSGDDVEFVELHNLYSIDIELSNWSLTGAVEFDFPSGTTIPAGGYLVVARNPSALQSATGYSSAYGPWTGALNNGGESVRLVMDAIGPRTMDEVEYRDSGQWPVQADGSGASLEKIFPQRSGSLASSWSWSQTPNGTPGAARSTATLPQVVINEIDAAASGSFFVELYNRGSVPVNTNNYVIVSSDDTRTDVVLTTGTINPESYAVITAATLGYTPADGEKLHCYTANKTQVIDSVIVGNFPKARYPDGDSRFSRPSTTTSGASNAVSISQDIVINEIFYRGYPEPGVPDTPATYQASTIINYTDIWRYENTGASLTAGWANSAHLSWPSGAALIGLESNTGSIAPHSIQTNLYNSGQITYYFEREFNFTGDPTNVQIRLTHKIDDGAVFYLNGVEIGRYAMPGGNITASTWANAAIEASEVVVILDATSLVDGSNRLSVEVHQGSNSSSDLVFGLQAELLTVDTPAIPGTPFTESDEEWIELYNMGTSPVLLDGWRLDDAVSFDIPANTTLQPGEYLVIAKNPTSLATKYPNITILGPWQGSLANSSERIQLEDANKNLVDEVRYYDAGRWSEYADGGGCSLELRDPRADNSIPESWSPSETSAIWQTYTYRAVATDNGFGHNIFHELIIGMLESGELLLDDISVIEDPDGAAIEFIQNGNFSADTVGSPPVGWRLLGNHGLHGKSVVVDDGGNKVLRLVATGASREFQNHLQTTYTGGQQVEVGKEYQISYRAKWVRGDNQLNTRLYFDWLSNTQHIQAATQWGTPGAVNSTFVANKGPDLINLKHSPTIPAVGQVATVEVTASDPDGIGSLQLHYRINHGTSFSSIAMTHQGDGRYTANIPGQPAGTLAQFYVAATDAHNSQAATESMPREGADSRAMVQWQDGQANTSVVHNIRILMRPQERQTLHTHFRHMSNHRFPATVIVDEQDIYYDCAVRFKGSAAGRNHSGSRGFNLSFDPMKLFNGVHTSISLERGEAQKQLLAKHIMNNSGKGMATLMDDPVRLVFPADSLGNGSYTSLSLLSASRYSSAWRNSQFDDGNRGTLYNFELLYSPQNLSGEYKVPNPYTHVRGSYEFKSYILGKETYRWGFQIRSNQREDNYSPLINAAHAIESGSVSAVNETIDINQWARTWAYIGLIGNDDIYTRIFDHNFRMFSRPSDDKLVALPWDLDRTFRVGTNNALIGNDNLGSFLNQPTVKRLFMQHVHDLCSSTYRRSYANPWASHFASRTGGSYNSFLNYIDSRRSYALGQLPANITFAITTNSGGNFSVSQSTTTLQGDGWIDVANITINGSETPVTWLDDQRWQIEVPLAVGANPITLTAKDLNGNSVGSDSITITNTSTTDLASDSNLVLSEMMYHPASPTAGEIAAGYDSDDDFEFIELLNTSVNEIDLSSCYFDDGITYTFPSGTLLGSGERLILAKNPAAFVMRYGSLASAVVGGYPDKLSNSGEILTLKAANDSVIFTIGYEDSGDWTEDADGDGYSLVNLDPTPGNDLNDPAHWSPSRELHGAAGSSGLRIYADWLNDHPQLAAANLALDTDDFDKDGFVNLLEFAFGSDPTDPSSQPALLTQMLEIDLGGGSGSYFTIRFTRPIAMPEVSFSPESSSTLNNDWVSDPATVNALFHERTRNGATETITYRTRNPISTNHAFLRMRVTR